MKSFFLDITIVFFSIFVIGESISRIFDLKTENIDFMIKDNDGFYSNEPYSTGTFVFGKPPSLYKRKFRFNDAGFNSSLNLNKFNQKKTNVAFLGDSYVESFHVDLYKSFSSILMDKDTSIQSYNFGVSGYAMEDFIWIYNKYNLSRFDYVFLFLGKNDFTSQRNRKKYNHKKEKLRTIYNSSHLISFLNYSHGFIKNVHDLFFKKTTTNKSNDNNISIEAHQKKFISKQNLLILPTDQIAYDFLIDENVKNIIKINHNLNPIDFGSINPHWNENGNLNVINSILKYIK